MSTSNVLNRCTGPLDCCSLPLKQINTIPDELPIMADFLSIKNSFRKSNTLCDVTLIAHDGVKIFAHKVVLASVSPFFLKMFTAAFKEKDSSIVNIRNIDSAILEEIINYMYVFQLKITTKNIEEIMMAANFLDLESVIVKCCDFIENNINFKNSIKFFELGKLLQEACKNLYYVTFSFILEHFFEIERSILLEMPFEDILKFISHDYLVTQTEDQIFNFVLDWVKFNEKNRKDFFCKLMKHVRLPLISKTFLCEVVSNTPLVKICFECSKLLIEALHVNLSKSSANLVKLSVRGKKRIPLYLKNRPNKIIIALQNSGEEKYVDFLDTSISSPKWKTGSSDFIPPNRYSKIVCLKNFLFAIGGFDEAGILTNDVFSLNLSYNWKFWVRRKSMMFRRQHFAVCTNENHIYVIGGIDGSNQQMVFEMEYFCINTKEWHLLSTMETPRKNCNAVYHNNIIYVIGGNGTNDREYILPVDCYNVSLNKWINGLKSLPNMMKNITSIVINNTIYVIGNYLTSNRVTLIIAFDLQIKGHGLQLSSFNLTLGDKGIAEANGKIYVIGGNSSTNRYNRHLSNKSTIVYDINKQNWSTLDTSLRNSNGNVLAVVVNKCFI